MTTIKILLVDDHPLVRDGLRARLEAMPQFEVVAEAGGAAEALEQAGRCGIDLVLMDINMRGTNGIEATAQFKQAFPRIAVLILSMHDKLEYVSQAIQAGARGYVLKDAPGKDIVVAIEIGRTGDGKGVTLRISDDGVGFDAEGIALHPKHGIGLRNMMERMDAIGGRFEIVSSSDGTLLSAYAANNS